MSQEERRHNKNKNRNRNRQNNKIDDEPMEFSSYDDYIEYLNSDKSVRSKRLRAAQAEIDPNIKKNRKARKSAYWEKEPIVKKQYVELDYTMDGSVKQLFLNLTKTQITFDNDKILEPFFPDGIKIDEHGNYFMNIGTSKTMFCGHIDTYSKKPDRVYHIIEGDIISSDGTTVLGGDDKAGMTIMLKMIEAKIPGLYYFFRGEEGVTSPTGTWGSKQAIKSYKETFKTYERCIAFDRKAFKSIISKQMYTECCSDEFVSALSAEFKRVGMDYEDDKTGMWCDSGVFMELIPECTNISVGYKSEHTFNETQDIKHLEQLCEAAIKINWDNLPVKRDPSKVVKGVGHYKYDYDYTWDYDNGYYRQRDKKVSVKKFGPLMDLKEGFNLIVDMLDTLGYRCLNEDMFEEAEEIYFNNAETLDFFGLRIINNEVYMSQDELLKLYNCIGTIEEFIKYIKKESGLSDFDNIKEIGSEEEEEDEDEKNMEKIQGERLVVYNKFISQFPDLIKELVDYLVKNKSPEVVHNLWYRIDKVMSDDLKLKMSYGRGIEGYDPDDFIEWVYDSIEYVSDKLEQNKKGSTNNLDADEIEQYEMIIKSYPTMTRDLTQELSMNSDVTTSLFASIERIINNWSDVKKSWDKTNKINLNANKFIQYVFDTLLKKKVSKKEKTANFSSYIDENNEYYSDAQDKAFCDFIEKERTLVKLILKDIEIQKNPIVRPATYEKINEALEKNYILVDGLKRINSKQLVLWIYDYTEQINDFYSDLPF